MIIIYCKIFIEELVERKKLNGDTDLDFRILLYDDFGKAIKDMINAT